MCPLCHHGCIPLNDLIIPMSTCYTPAYRLPGILQRSISPLRLRCQVRGADLGAPVLGALRVALCRSRRAQVAAVVLCRARGGQLLALLQGRQELASRRPQARWWLVRLLLCANQRVDPLDWWVRAFRCCLVGIQVGARGRPQRARVAHLPTGRYLACCL